MKKEKESYKPLPFVRKVDRAVIENNYQQIKKDVENIADAVLQELLSDPDKSHLIIKKNQFLRILDCKNS